MLDIFTKEQEAAMETALNTLSDACRETLRKWMVGYTHEKIAEERGVRKDTVTKAIPNCQEKLHNYLLDHPQLLKIIRGK